MAGRLRFLALIAAAAGLMLAVPAGNAGTPARGQAASPVAFDLNAALAAAQPGDTIRVPAGEYAGPLIVDKPLILEGDEGAVIQGPGDGDVVRLTAPGITLRGFTVRGTGISLDREHAAISVEAPGALVENNRVEDALFGIYLKKAADTVVRGNTILGKDLPISRRGDGIKIFYSDNSLLEGNMLRDSRDALIWFSPGTDVIGNVFEHGRYGMHFMQTSDHHIEGNVLRNNSVGIYLMYGTDYVLRNNLMLENRGPSGYGLGLKEVDRTLIEGNGFVSNRIGIYNDLSPLRPENTVELADNLFAYNEIGLLFLPNVRRNFFSGNNFVDNAEQVNISGGGELAGNEWSVDGRGNYWSDYVGFDADRDGVGDLPYATRSLYESMLAKHPELRLFQHSPAADALDLAAKAFPIFAPRPIMADPDPLTAPVQAPPLPLAPGMEAPAPLAGGLASAAMLGLALAVLAAGVRGRVRRFFLGQHS